MVYSVHFGGIQDFTTQMKDLCNQKEPARRYTVLFPGENIRSIENNGRSRALAANVDRAGHGSAQGYFARFLATRLRRMILRLILRSIPLTVCC